MLNGAHVRDERGATGRILGWGADVCIGWQDGKHLLPREERLALDSARVHDQIQVWTLGEGWQPLARFAAFQGGPSTMSACIQQLRSLISETLALDGIPMVESMLDEKTKHYPFKNKQSIGKGPRGSTNKATDHWNCKCSSPYTCKCKGADGEKKTVNIDPDYKSDYNAEYRRWKAKKG